MPMFKGKYGPLLIAEIGGNHEGNFDYAKRLTELAIESGADVVKFQIYTGDTLVSSLESPDRNKHFKKFELTPKQHIELAKMVISTGLKYTASVWDIDALSWIDEYLSFYKIGSGDLTAYPLLKQFALKGKPIVLSTGLATENEVLDAVKYIQEINPVYTNEEMLAVLQCTSMYPINDSDANLNVMHRLQELTNLSIGYSDHTEGSKALLTAVAMGAKVLEFHFTDERENKTFRDHKVSLTKDEVLLLTKEISKIIEIQGSSKKEVLKIEKDNQHEISFRRAVYPSIDIKKGEVLNENNLTVLRPNHGIDAREYQNVIGKVAIIDLKKHQKLDWEFFN